MDFGSAVGRTQGLTDRDLQEIARSRDSDAFTPVEKLAIELAEHMSRTPADVPDELFAELRKYMDEAQLVELAATIAVENFAARFNRVFDVQSQGFSEGVFCVLPAP